MSQPSVRRGRARGLAADPGRLAAAIRAVRRRTHRDFRPFDPPPRAAYGPQDKNRIVAVDSFRKNADCRGDNYSYRLDRQVVIDWILSKPGADAAAITVN